MMPAKKRARTVGPTQVDASPPGSAGACPPFTAGVVAPLLGPAPEARDKRDDLLEAGGPTFKAEQPASADLTPGGIPGGLPPLGAATVLATHVRVPGIAELFEADKVNALSREN